MKLFLFFLSLIMLSDSSYAESSALFDQKSKLEKVITERMKNLVSTTLDRNSFDVNVSLKMRERKVNPKPAAEKNEVKDEFSSLEDMQLGLINAQDLIRTYEKELEALRLAKQEANQQKAQVEYDISEVFVQVGLSDQLDEQYVKEFTEWLSKRVSAEFGKIGKSAVGIIKTKAIEKTQKTYFDYLKDFQLSIAAILGVLGCLMAILLFKLIKSKDAEADRQLRMQMSGQALGFTGAGKSESKPELAGSRKTEISMHSDKKAAKDLMGKLVAIMVNGDIDMNRIVEFWLSSDSVGLKKTACIFDALLAHSSAQNSDSENVEILRSIRISSAFKSKLAETLASMRDLPLDEKVTVLESAYWDILSFQTVGDEGFKKPFIYASQVEPRVMKNILLKQPSKVRSMVILALPDQVKGRIVSEFSESEKKELIVQSMNNSEIQRSELDSVSDAIKFQITTEKKTENNIKSLELLPSLLATFTPYEEVYYLCDAKRSSPDLATNLLKYWPSFAFMEFWTEESLKKMVGRLSSEEIESLIRINFEVASVVLDMCTPRVREIVNDSLRVNKAPKITQLMDFIGSARAKMDKMIESKELSIETLYKPLVWSAKDADRQAS